MKCKKCGENFKSNDKYCTNCGQKKKNNVLLIISIISSIILIFYVIIFIRIGRYLSSDEYYESIKDQYVHEYDDFINYVETKTCGKSSCNLSGNYEVVKQEDGRDGANKETRTITFKIKNTDLTFSVKSSRTCLKDMCFKKWYELTDDYNKKATEYYFDQYNKSIGYNNEYCYMFDDKDECNSSNLNVKNNEELEFVINYINGFVDYKNTLDIKFGSYFSIYFPKIKFTNEYNGEIYNYYYHLYVDVDLVDNKYTLDFNEYECTSNDGTLKACIDDFMARNDIEL